MLSTFRKVFARTALGFLGASSLLTASISAQLIAANPLIAFYVEDEATAIGARLEAAMATEVTTAWVDERLAAAMDAQPRDWSAIESLDTITSEYSVEPSSEIRLRLEAARAEDSGFIAGTKDCFLCLWDTDDCRSVAQLAVCRGWYEVSPFSDVVVLTREAKNWFVGGEVDNLGVALATLGLSATIAIPLSGGSSVSLKAAIAILRLARTTGRLSVHLAAILWELGEGLIKWDQVPLRPWKWSGEAFLKAADSSKLAALRAVAGDLGGIADKAGKLQAFRLLSVIDTPGDARKVRTLASAIGPKTESVFMVLGKSRVFRTMLRVSDQFVNLGALILALAAQVGLFLGSVLAALLRVGLRRAAR